MKRFIVCLAAMTLSSFVFAQEPQPQEQIQGSEQSVEQAEIKDSLAASQNVTLDFKDADINSVLKIMAQKANVNIVPTPDVMGTVSIKLNDVPWERALDVILKSNGFGFQRQGNVILVTKIENMGKIQAEEPLRTEILNLKFLDAQDAMRILIPMLSSRGKISILYATGQKGWKFGTFKIGGEETEAGMMEKEKSAAPRQEIVSIEKNEKGDPSTKKIEVNPSMKSKTLIITDTDSTIDRIKSSILPQIDRMPKQVLVEARFMEVNRDRLKDLGIDYATGSQGVTGVTTSATSPTYLTVASKDNVDTRTGALRALGTEITPSVFGPKAASIGGVEPFTTGLELVYRKLTGTEFELVLHALEEDVHTNTLSSPKIMTLDNQEASILVGYHTPILSSEVSTDTSGVSKLTQTLDYYQEIGIRLNVVPQVSEGGYINMIIHPSITSSASNVSAVSISGNLTATTNYPIIDVREAQTQIMMRDGETVVIGGLLKDVKSKSVIGVPFLSKIPFIGALFRRETIDTAKIDLLIFITARVMKEDEFSPDEIKKIEAALGDPLAPPARKPKEKKK